MGYQKPLAPTNAALNYNFGLGLNYIGTGKDARLKASILGFAKQSPTEGTIRFLEALVERSPHEDVQAMARYALGASLSKLPTDQRDDQRIESLLQQVIDGAGDQDPLKQVAEDFLFEFKHLAIGRIAPDIEGKDLDGQPFKLSDYRGKVVMLDFWGDW